MTFIGSVWYVGTTCTPPTLFSTSCGSQGASVWHNAWCDSDGKNCGRPGEGLDIFGPAGTPVSAVVHNIDWGNHLSIRAYRSTDCIVGLTSVTTDTTQKDMDALKPEAALPIVRYVHLNLGASDPYDLKNAKANSWVRIVADVFPNETVGARLSVTSPHVSSGSDLGKDICGHRSDGPHLHMDGPPWATRNCNIQQNQNLTSAVWAIQMDSAAWSMQLVSVKYTGTHPMTIQLAGHGQYRCAPDDPVRRMRRLDAAELIELPSFEIEGEAKIDRFEDLEEGCDSCSG